MLVLIPSIGVPHTLAQGRFRLCLRDLPRMSSPASTPSDAARDEQLAQLLARLSEQLHRISQGEPPLSPSIARRVIQYFTAQARQQPMQEPDNVTPHVQLTDRENEVLLRVAKGYTLPEIGGWSRATDEEKRRVWELIPERLRQRQALEG